MHDDKVNICVLCNQIKRSSLLKEITLNCLFADISRITRKTYPNKKFHYVFFIAINYQFYYCLIVVVNFNFCLIQAHKLFCFAPKMQTLTIRVFIWIKRHLYLGVSLPQLATPDLDMAQALIYSPPIQTKISSTQFFYSAYHDNGK